MTRGNGKDAQKAKSSGKLAAFVSPHGSEAEASQQFRTPDWSEVSGPLIVGAVVSVVAEGGAVMFGCSRDHKSYSVRVYDGDSGHSWYFPCTYSGVEELEAFLLALGELATAVS